MIRTVKFSVTLPVEIIKRKKWYLASCPILDVHSQGDTERKALNNLKDALSLFFVSCFERGTLDIVLKNCGFKAVHTLPTLKKEPEHTINVPIPFLVDQKSRYVCHA